jgi:tungstate transport system ATP-binding protein
MSIMLRIFDMAKSYDGKEVLAGCTYEFPGGITALMGPNGSGKSTLLRICEFLEEPTAGSVHYFDEQGDVPHDLELRRKITLVLPRAGIFNTTVFKNAAYGLKLRGIGRAETRRRVREVLDKAGLLHKERQNSLSLSSGESQRLAIARAMVLRPDVLLLDEPTASVDEENTAIIEETILGMVKWPHGSGKAFASPTVIFATHDRAQAGRLSSRILNLSRGRIVD